MRKCLVVEAVRTLRCLGLLGRMDAAYYGNGLDGTTTAVSTERWSTGQPQNANWWS